MAKVTKRRGKWVVDYRLNGKRHVHSFPTKRNAEDFYRELKLRKANAVYGHRSLTETPLRVAIHKYVELNTSKKSFPTRRGEKNYFERLFEYFGNVNVSDIMLIDLEEFQSHLLNVFKVKNSTINRHFNTYKNFFSKCEDWGFIKYNPTRKLKSLKVRQTTKRLWKDDEIEKLICAAEPWAKDIFFTFAMTGMRRSELVRLKWKNIQFDYKVIEVHSRKGTGDDRVRFIPMVDNLVELLTKKKETARTVFMARDDDYVFLNSSSKPVSATHTSRELFRLTEKLGLKGLNLHALRHTFLTRMVSSNVSVEKARMIAGHSNLRTTQQYLHIDNDELHQAMNKGTKDRTIRLIR